MLRDDESVEFKAILEAMTSSRGKRAPSTAAFESLPCSLTGRETLEHTKGYFDLLRILSLFHCNACIPSMSSTAGTFNWLDDHPAFRTWLAADTHSRRTLWIHGKHGSGSSILAALAADRAAQALKDKHAIIIGFRFDSNHDGHTSTFKLFSSLSFQLLCALPGLFEHVSRLYNHIGDLNSPDEKPRLRLDRLWVLLRTLLSCPEHGNVICLIEGIDECDSSSNRFLEDFVKLPYSAPSAPRLVASSVTGSDSYAHVCSESRIDLDEKLRDGKDVEISVKSMIDERSRSRNLYRKAGGAISQAIRQSSPTMLTASLALELLDTGMTSTCRAVDETLQSLPGTVSGLCEKLISQAQGTRSSWGLAGLCWIAHAARPLTLSEISVAVAIQCRMVDGQIDVSYDKNDVLLDPASDLHALFGGLVVIRDNKVYFVNKALQADITQRHTGSCKGQCDLCSGHVFLAHACLTYLDIMMPQSPVPLYTPGSSVPPPADDEGLLAYAVQYWPKHYQKAVIDDNVRPGFHRYFETDNLINNWAYRTRTPHDDLIRPTDAMRDPLSVASEFGTGDLVSVLLEDRKSEDVKVKGSMALGYAIEMGHVAIVRKLVKAEVSNWRALHIAAAYDQKPIISYLLSVDYSASEANSQGLLPIHVAAECGSLRAAELLLEGRAQDANKGANDGTMPLHLASQFGHPNMVRTLLQKKANPNATLASGSTALHLACEWQQLEAIGALLKGHAKVNAIDNSRRTPLHLAASTGRTDVVDLLLRDLDDDARNSLLESQDEDGKTPLHIAAEMPGHMNIVEKLLTMSSRDEMVLMQDDKLRVPLHLAAKNGDAAAVKALMEEGPVQIAETDQDQSNPIHFAIQGGSIDVVERLCKQHDVQDVSLNVFNSSKMTPLHLACDVENAAMVKTLLEYRAQAEIVGGNNETPLHIACRKGLSEISEILLHNGANPTSTTADGSSPLHLASAKGCHTIVAMLLNRSRDVDIADHTGRRPIHRAAQGGHGDVVIQLLEIGADPELVDNEGMTLLHYTCEGGSARCVRTLLDSGIGGSVDDKDSKDRTPLHIASKAGNYDVITELLHDEAAPSSHDKDGKIPLELASDEKVIQKLLEVTPRPWNTAKTTEMMQQAASLGHTGVMEKLLAEPEIDITVLVSGDMSLLDLAAKNGHPAVAELLLEVPSTSPERGESGRRTPVSYASEHGHNDVLKLLLDRGWDANSFDDDNRSPASYAAEAGRDDTIQLLYKAEAAICRETPDGTSPLLFAAINGHHTTVELLLSLGSNPNVVDSSGKSCLHMAAEKGHTKVARALLDCKEFNAGNSRDQEASTAMYIAAYYGRAEIVAAMLEKGLDKEKPGPNGWRPLHAAHDSLAVVRILLRTKPEIDAKAGDGRTSLAMAIEGHYEEVVEELLEHGANPLVPDQSGKTPLHVAASKPAIRPLRLMLKLVRKSKINTPDGDKETPFSLAVRAGSEEAAQLIMKKGDVDLTATNASGQSRCGPQ